jgi:hypothetical protein
MRRHPFDLASLIAGVVFVAISAAYLVGAYTDVLIGSGWVLPLALIGLGAAGLAGSLRRGLRTDDSRSAEAQSTDPQATDTSSTPAAPE